MKEKLIKILQLDPKADEAAIVDAVSDLKAAVEANKPSKRELLIREKMRLTGMQRHDAEHVVDEQAREDKARAKAKK